MTYWLIKTDIGHFQFDDQMGDPIHFLSGLLKNCIFYSMVPIEAEDPTPAPRKNETIERVDVNPHDDGQTHLLGGFSTGNGRWTCHSDCHCKKPSEANQEEVADEHGRKVRKVREVNEGRPLGCVDHCGHCGAEGRRRSRLKKCSAVNCGGHCDDCLSNFSCNWSLSR